MLDVYYQQNYTPHFKKIIIRLSRTKQPSAWIRIHKCFDENELPFFKKKIHKKETKLIFIMGGGGVTSSGVQKVLLFQTSRLGVNSTHWLFAARWRMIGHAWLASCPQRGPFLALASARLHSLVFWFLLSVLRNFCRIFLFDLEGRCVEAICHRDWICNWKWKKVFRNMYLQSNIGPNTCTIYTLRKRCGEFPAYVNEWTIINHKSIQIMGFIHIMTWNKWCM